MRQMFRILGFLLLAGGSFEALGLLSHDLDRFVSFLGLALLLATFAGELAGGWRPDRRALLLAVLCFAAAVPAAVLAPLGRAYFHLFVLAGVVLLLSRAPGAARRELACYVLALCLMVLLAEMARFFALVWHMKVAAAALLSGISGRLAREPRDLGPTAMGLPLLAGLAMLVLARAALRAGRGRPRAWLALVLLLAAHLAYLVMLTPVATWIDRHRPAWEGLLLNSQWLFLLLGAGTLASANTLAEWKARRAEAVSAKDGETAEGTAPVSRPTSLATWRRGLADPRLVSGFCLGMILVLLAGRSTVPGGAGAPPVRVMLYDAGYTNWKIPQHGSYGEKSGGMFGILPYLLQAAGHRVQKSADLNLLDAAGAPDCLVLINIQEYLEPADKERILRFVRRGGGLLCLGDHTGVAGIRGPFNDFLSPLGIRLVFDSATFFAGGWSNALELREHALNHGIVNEEDYQIWVGASLEIEPGITPVVVGRYGYSDLGDMANLQRSFLGDRRYNPDELLGDVVLAAEARLGRGKILVFGDTSGYQNLALPRSWAFVLRSIDYLGHPGGARPGAAVQLLVLLGFAVLLGITSGAGRYWPAIAAATGGVLVASVLVTALSRPRPVPALDWARATPLTVEAAASNEVRPQRTALVDRSHGGRYDLRAWYDTSVGGLLLNLVRDGFFPVVCESFPRRELETADLMVLIAPARPYSRGERQALRRFMERGGRLLVCVGFEELDGARDLLRDYGLGVREVPLAHFRTGDTKGDLVFLEAWALECPSAARVLVRQWGDPVAASLPVGRGELVLIGDAHWPLNRNLEGRENYFPGNIAFLSALDSGKPIQPIEGKFGVLAREPAPLADAPPAPGPPAGPPAPAPTPQGSDR